MATPNIVPRADSEGGIGTASKYWASAYIDLIYVGAGKVGRDADNLIDFSTDNNITFRINTNNELTLDSGQLYPVTNNGLSLGAAGYGFSDLYLASGAVIKFNNGDVTLTHSNNALTLADGDALHFGTDNDLRLFHTSGESLVQNTVGHLYIQNTADDKDIIFSSDDGSGGVTTYLTLDGGAGFMIANKKMRFLDSAAAAFGDSDDLEIYHDGNTSIRNDTGNLTILNRADDGDIIFQSDDGSGGVTAYLTLDGSAGYTTVQKNMNFADDIKATFGNSNDLKIDHDSSGYGYIQNLTGHLYFVNGADDKDIIFQGDDGAGGEATYFYVDGSSATHDGSATTALYTNWPDKSIISLGTSHDLRIYHDGSSGSYIANHTGVLQIESWNDDLQIINYADDKDIIFQSDDGSGGVETYFFLDGSANSGNLPITVFPDNSKLTFGNGYDLRIVHDGTNSALLNETGDLFIQQNADDKDIRFQCDNGSGGLTDYIKLDGGYTTPQIIVPDGVNFNIGTSLDLALQHQGDNSTITNNTGNLTIVNNTNDGDIIFQSEDGGGGVTTYFTVDGSARDVVFAKDIVLNDNVNLRVGTGHDLRIYHNGSNSFIQDTGTGDLRILSSHLKLMDTSENLVLGVQAGGVAVTGDVSITSTAASAVGGGFDGAETATIQIGEVNQEIITTIQIDLGTGGATDIVSSSTAGDVIGENDTAAAFITKYDSTKSGVLYKAELICLETPAGGDTDINLVLNATSLAEDAAGETEGHVIVDGGAQTIGMRTESTASVVTAAAGAHNDYIYLTHGGTTAGTYSAGKFLIRLYGAKATL